MYVRKQCDYCHINPSPVGPVQVIIIKTALCCGHNSVKLLIPQCYETFDTSIVII